MMSFFFGGLLPVISFTLIEEYYGVIPGLIAAMVFGVGEIAWEYLRYKKIEKITLIGNFLVLFLGGISLFTQEGLWFKLQPAIMEFAFAIILIGSWVLKKPLMVVLSMKQGQQLNDFMQKKFGAITFRLGLFFIFQAILAVYAALYLSTAVWAFLKGVGIFIFMAVYLFFEVLMIRREAIKQQRHQSIPNPEQ